MRPFEQWHLEEFAKKIKKKWIRSLKTWNSWRKYNNNQLFFKDLTWFWNLDGWKLEHLEIFSLMIRSKFFSNFLIQTMFNFQMGIFLGCQNYLLKNCAHLNSGVQHVAIAQHQIEFDQLIQIDQLVLALDWAWKNCVGNFWKMNENEFCTILCI